MTVEFDEWFGTQLPRLLRFATALCGGPDPAEDVLQDVAVKAHARWDRIGGLEHPEAYLRRMVVNEYLSWRRRWGRSVPVAELVDVPEGGLGFAEQHAERAALVAELARLPRRQKAVLVLRYLEDLSDDVIAETLGCSTGTVRSHASRALVTLRVEMATPPTASTTVEEGSHAY